jgi:hypothetical protein
LRGALIAGLAAVGLSLTLAAIVLALSSWLGPIAGLGLSGLTLLFIAGTLRRYSRSVPYTFEGETTARIASNLEAASFLLGFVLSRIATRRIRAVLARRRR